jgi:hypothetical protein
MPANHTEVEKHLWEAADELRANSKLKSSEYSVPVLGLKRKNATGRNTEWAITKVVE